MAILKLSSNSDKFSFLLSKNPSSGMIARKIKNGYSFGWYYNNDYIVYFKDADDSVSFGVNNNQEFEYNDVTKYTSPLVYFNLLREFFSSFNKENQYDEFDKTYSISVESIYLKNKRVIDTFIKHYKDFNFKYTELCRNTYKVEISTNNQGMIKLYSLLNVFLIFNQLNNQFNYYLENELIEKFLKLSNKIDTPFFIKYWFKVKLCRSKESFNKLKDYFLFGLKDVEMFYGDSAIQRDYEIRNHIDFKQPIVDIGCNDMNGYGYRYADKLKDNTVSYHAIDIDENALEMAKKKCNNRNLNNVEFYNSIEEYIETSFNEESQIILSEVVEHIEYEESIKFVKKILNEIKFNKFILTTPNKDFNYLYEFEEGETRHDDHKFELTQDEFIEYVKKLNIDETKYKIEFKQVGDLVKSVGLTQMIIVSKI